MQDSVCYFGTMNRFRSSDQPLAPAISRNEYLILGGILLVGLALRLARLDAALWYDEVNTLVDYVRLPLAQLFTQYDSLNNHVFFTLQGKASIGLFGESAWALRLPAVLWGVASLWALWLLARRVVPVPEALMATALMAVSYHHVWFSQNARGYTGLLFLGLIALVLVLEGMRRPSWRIWLGFGFVFACAMYTHLSAAFYFAALGLTWILVLALMRMRGQEIPRGSILMPLVGALFGLALTAAIYLPMIDSMITTFTAVQSGPEDAVRAESIAQWKNPLWTLAEIVRGLGPILGPALPVALAVMSIAMVRLYRTAPVLPLVLVLHIALTIALLVALSFRVWPRYFLGDLGLICLFLIHGATGLGDWLATRLRLSIANPGQWLALLGIVSTLVLLPKNYLYPKQDFTGARDYVETHRAADAQVIALGLTVPPYRDYFAPHWAGADSLAEFQSLHDPEQETWIVYTFPSVTRRRHADILSTIEESFSEADYFHGTLAGGGIVVLKSNAPE
ncbi:glycosyltransferase family 39 protein [Ruegeria sp. HKCCA6707]|uniref:glycosyltransferase family 39 protein n=2 Tax=Ruegeria TaxID=97050 RepID=UPI001489894B|nr:glycosyltransferase family 39 protein [Ruegeria sp. HKCCA6707]